MTMTRVTQETITNFEVNTTSPSPEEVIEGYGVIKNNFGNVALSDFRKDLENPNSVVFLDATVEPPVLYLNEADARFRVGHTNINGEFEPLNDRSGSHIAKVSGVYTGPGSQLELV